MVGVDERPTKPREKMGEARSSGGIFTTIREYWGCDKVGGDGGESIGDTAGREVVVQCIYGVREG